MRCRTAGFVVVICLASLSVVTHAQTTVAKGEAKTVTATIEAIDRQSRIVTLKTEDGRMVQVQASDEVKRFDSLKVGDKVTGTYYQSVVLSLQEPGQPPQTFSDEAVNSPVTGTTGTKPGGTVARQVKGSVTVEDIDTANSTITVKGDRGRVVEMRVNDPKALAQVKKGDRINVTYTEAFLVSVR